MLRLVEEGKVRAAGVSNFDAGLLARPPDDPYAGNRVEPRRRVLEQLVLVPHDRLIGCRFRRGRGAARQGQGEREVRVDLATVTEAGT